MLAQQHGSRQSPPSLHATIREARHEHDEALFRCRAVILVQQVMEPQNRLRVSSRAGGASNREALTSAP
jgi:hypothetical protein